MCKNMLEILFYHAEFGGTWTLCAAGAAKTFLFVCLSVTLVNNGIVNDRICAHNFALKALEYINNIDTIG